MRNVSSWKARLGETYEKGTEQAGPERPLRGYAVLLTTYGALTAAGAAVIRRRGVTVDRPSGVDLALLVIGTFRVSRTLAKDAVIAPLRAPFTTYQGPAGPGEVMEAPRPGPVRHAVGELVSCPFCMTQWVGTAGLIGYALFPRTTRWISAGMSTVAMADALQFAYAKLQQSTE